MRNTRRGGEHTAATDLCRKGALLSVLSAPRSRAGRQRIKLAADSPVVGDTILVILTFVGNMYFGQKTLRRGSCRYGAIPPAHWCRCRSQCQRAPECPHSAVH